MPEYIRQLRDAIQTHGAKAVRELLDAGDVQSANYLLNSLSSSHSTLERHWKAPAVKPVTE
jgi:hypothetical protein